MNFLILSPSDKPTFLKKMVPFLLIVPSAIIGVILVELFCRFFVPSIGNNTQVFFQQLHRVMFFDGPATIFRNHGDIFTYVPHSEIRNLSGFYSDDDNFNVEYDYHFSTNNFGLVQNSDITPGRESLLLLGDSFCQGLGAEPWFQLVSPEIEKLGYQAVNGGLMGTGFKQWLKLDRYLETTNVDIRKLVVLFISDDFRRPVWNLTPGASRCLSALPGCRVEEGFAYRLPAREEFSSWIAKVRTARGSIPKVRAAALLPASFHVYKYFEEFGRSKREGQESRASISELIGKYGVENVVFVHLPEKDEVDNGPNSLGLEARRSIQELGGKLVDGFKVCRLTATDYYPNDDHPNSGGYAKIAFCVTNIINTMIGGAQ